MRRAVKLRGGAVMLCFAIAIAVAPLSLLVINALKTQSQIVTNPLALPISPQWHNFGSAWIEGGFSLGLFNSVVLCGCTVAITVFAASLAAYPLARRRTRLWKLIALYFLGCVTVPVQMFLFPLYYVYAGLGLVGNLLATALILAAINLPLAVLLLRANVIAIPIDLDDAARMDGAGHWATFRHVILPLIRPGMITVGVIVLLNSWNEFLITSTFQQGAHNFTMTLGYLALNGSLTADQGLLMAGALIVIAPVLIIFIAMQRYFVAGMMSGAIKG
jgi:raffinose/stachyose/melibiose transport system permease protein